MGSVGQKTHQKLLRLDSQTTPDYGAMNRSTMTNARWAAAMLGEYCTWSLGEFEASYAVWAMAFARSSTYVEAISNIYDSLHIFPTHVVEVLTILSD